MHDSTHCDEFRENRRGEERRGEERRVKKEPEQHSRLMCIDALKIRESERGKKETMLQVKEDESSINLASLQVSLINTSSKQQGE